MIINNQLIKKDILIEENKIIKIEDEINFDCEILDAKDRRKAGITANPEGLYLKDVFYK